MRWKAVKHFLRMDGLNDGACSFLFQTLRYTKQMATINNEIWEGMVKIAKKGDIIF